MSVQCFSSDESDDFASIYEPLSKDGAYLPYKPRAIEDLQESFKAERLNIRYQQAAPSIKVRRLASVVRSRELLKQKAQEVTEPPLVEAKKEDERLEALRGGAWRPVPDVDTEAEDSEVSVEISDSGRPSFLEGQQELLDGCHHLVVRAKGPLHSPDEPPDFLQLPEPIKQRTAGAARVAAAARAWAAASSSAPGNGPPAGAFIGQAAGGEVVRFVAVMVNQANQANNDLPPTARGNPERTAAQIMADLRQQGHDAQRAPELRVVEHREAVAGPAVLALRRMRNRMSSLADNLPFRGSSPREGSDRRGRSLLPTFSRTAASSNGAASSSRGPAPGGGGAEDIPMQSLVPTPPPERRPKPNGRFWSRPWPRGIMNSLGFSSQGGSSAAGAASSGGQH